MKTTFVFKKLSPELEEVLMEELHTLKGGSGGGSDGSKWDDTLKEVEIVGQAPPDPPAAGEDDDYEDPEPEEDPWDDENWGEGDPVDDLEPQCTCEIGPNENNSQIPEITDSNNLLSNLKTELNSRLNLYNNILTSGNLPPGIQQSGIHFGITTINQIMSIINNFENSGKSYQFILNPNMGNSGETTKDINSNQYIITVGNGDFGLLIHEIMHINQIENGQVGFDQNGNPTMLGLDDELTAFQLQFNFEAGASGNPTLATENYILTNYPHYNNLPKTGGSCPVHG